MQKLTFTLFFMLLLIAPKSFSGRIGSNIALRPNVTFQLNKVLISSESLRLALLNQDEDQIEICLRELSWEVDQARILSMQVRDFDRRHLLKILDNIKANLEVSFSSFGGDRRDLFLKAFNQMANLVRIYQVDSRFSIFYCPKDHATWVQASNKPQNPFRGPASASKDCGIKVNRSN